MTSVLNPDLAAGVSPGELLGFRADRPLLTDLFWAQLEYLYVDDIDASLVTLAAVASQAVEDGEPLWLMLVGASSGGKGENLRLVDQVVHRRIKDVTLAGLLTRTQGRSARTTGLLTEVEGQNAVVTITDFSSLLGGPGKSGEQKADIFNALRDIFDGAYSRTMNNGTAEWHGRLTLAAACTPAIDRYGTHSDSLGTRWLYYRLRERDVETRRRVSQMAAGRSEVNAKREAAAEVAARAVAEAQARLRRGDPETLLDEGLEALVVECALLASYGRADVPRESWGSREICDVATAEEPGRVTHQLRLLARGLLAVGCTREKAARLVRTVALGSMPAARSLALQALVGMGGGQSSNAIARRTGLNVKVAHRALEDWEAVRLIESSGSGGGTVSHEWQVSDEFATIAAIAGNLVRNGQTNL